MPRTSRARHAHASPSATLGSTDFSIPAPAERTLASQPADVEHLVGPRGVRALAPRRRLAHPAGERAPAGVGAGGAAVIAQRGHRVDREQGGVDRRLGLAADAVAAIARVPQVVHALGDRVDEGPVAGLGEPGGGVGGARRAGAASRRSAGRGERRAGGEARATGHEVAAGERGGHALTVGHARAREQPPKGDAAAPQVGDLATLATATSAAVIRCRLRHAGDRECPRFDPAGHATFPAHGRQIGRCVP